MRGGRRWLPHSKELDADRGNLEVRLLRLALAMKDVERVLRVVLQAADVLGAEFGEVERVRLFTVHAAEVDLVLGSGLEWCVCGVLLGVGFRLDLGCLHVYIENLRVSHRDLYRVTATAHATSTFQAG